MSTISKYYIGEPEWVSPHNLKLDEKVAQFNPAKPEHEYEALKLQIETDGQTDPAYVRNELLGDGRHRSQIAQELGRKLLIQRIDPSMPDDEYIRLCNKNTFGARNDTPAQSAIKAYTLVKMYGYTDVKAVKMIGVKDPKLVQYVRYILDTRHAKVIEHLKAGGKAEIKSLTGEVVYRGIALKSIKTQIAKLEEEEMLIIDDTEKIVEAQVDYNDYLNTEMAKEVFWTTIGKNEYVSADVKKLMCELLNLKYKLKEKTDER
jgi:hypothetical protein